MKTELEFKLPSAKEAELYKQYFKKDLLFSFENFKNAKSVDIVKSKKDNILKRDAICSIETILLKECEPKQKIHNKLLKLEVNGVLYSLSSLVFNLNCLKCKDLRRIHCHPSRDLSTFKSLLCESCYKSTTYSSKEYREKYKKTMMDRYGGETPLQSPELSAKIRQTMIERYGVPYSAMNFDLWKKSVHTTREKYFEEKLFGHSISEKMFATEISSLCDGLKMKTMSCLNQPFQIKICKKTYILDFFINDKNLAIEFFGDFFHGNPKIYDENDLVGFKGMTRKEINAKDEARIHELNSAGIHVHIVWENDWKHRKTQVLNDLKEILNGGDAQKTFQP